MVDDDDFNLQPLLDSIRLLYRGADPAHDFSHILRVSRNARIIGLQEGADMQVLMLASLLHDVGPDKKAELAGDDCVSHSRKAVQEFLERIGLDVERSQKVIYAVEVHRYSRGIVPVTLEARILQDADRLDAMGAIGIARVFLTGGFLGRELYHPQDPFCKNREPDDGQWNLDHFYKKLLRLESGMHTESARGLAAKRTAVLKKYLSDLQEEIGDGCDTENSTCR